MNSTFLILLAGALVIALASAQGPLTPPPGAPSPVMKSLDQVEARTPLVAGQPGVTVEGATGAITINKSGSYYLTGNLATETANIGITIAADDVVLDLNGFLVIRTTGKGAAAISSDSHKGIWIKNGSIVGGTTQVSGTFTLAGWSNGIQASQPEGSPARVSDVIIRGVRSRGISLWTSNASIVERCMVDTCGEIGISALTVIDCVVRNTNDDAIWTGNDSAAGTVSNCVGVSVGLGLNGYGIRASGSAVTNSKGVALNGIGLSAGTATNCSGVSITNSGISADINATNCTGTSGSGTGISVGNNATNCTGTSGSGTGISVVHNATNCFGNSSTGTALIATNASNCIGYSTSGPYGINVTVGTASFCRGGRSGGTAINAGIAIGCTAGGGSIVAAQKHLGTP